MDQIIYVNGKKMNTYVSGNGDMTCIFLSGSSVLSPKWEYMTLINEVSQYCKTIVIEKLGYGYSDLTECPREIDTVIDEYRYVGKGLGIKTPIILMAHSMGFLEAIRWTQRFPDEIAGIIGIDAATPNAYKDFNVEKQLKSLMFLEKSHLLKKILAHITFKRLCRQRTCTENEKKRLKDVAFTKILNAVWISEAKYLRKNIDTINKSNAIQVPMLFFISNGKGTTQTKKVWREHALDYLSHREQSQYELVEYPHNLYEYMPKEIASRSKEFISEL
ncbi:MAG: alpha/beta fold hydrolase [Cellulosilyticaceae bacterium]